MADNDTRHFCKHVHVMTSIHTSEMEITMPFSEWENKELLSKDKVV